MESLHTRLKIEAAVLHRKLDALPLFDALSRGILDKISIVSFLRTLAIIHAVLESSLASSSSLAIRELSRPKLPLLLEDLQMLKTEILPSITPALQIALHFGAEILRHCEDISWLTGLLYVLEGSQNGAMVLRDAYAKCLRVSSEQLAYFGCYGKETHTAWLSFIERLESLAASETQDDTDVNAAIRSFEVIGDICARLCPFSENDLSLQASDINPEAGGHTVPQNPMDIVLALQAGKMAWEAFPYLQMRFGERGMRFTSSDSCWLLALTQLPTEAATKNLNWLRRVLAPRGIPTIILTQHLRQIAKLLNDAHAVQSSCRSESYTAFLDNVDLEQKYTNQYLHNSTQEFSRKMASCSGLRVPDAAELIASAWLDERAGITGAFEASKCWFVSPATFSPDWIELVEGFVAELINA